MSRRTQRVASLIRTILGEAIQNRLSDPRIEPLTSITRVEVSADLSVAHVYVSVMAEEARQRLSLTALRHAAGRLRSLVASEITLRQTPQLDFHLDDSLQRSFQTVEQLDRMMEELDRQTPQDTAQKVENPVPESQSQERNLPVSMPQAPRKGEPQAPADSPTGNRICQGDADDGVRDVQEDV